MGFACSNHHVYTHISTSRKQNYTQATMIHTTVGAKPSLAYCHLGVCDMGVQSLRFEGLVLVRPFLKSLECFNLVVPKPSFLVGSSKILYSAFWVL